ncbi:hypothetical protein NUM_07610 [Actinocatenispora comari]|uniref:PrgI family protein n=2 Tax=Actinocatenispora comari TaxID=2807577 RepID=A0A8J4EIQ6_9ACTN|nr:hypothetical protein NUM_07610 [Actinocatenispora comari]
MITMAPPNSSGEHSVGAPVPADLDTPDTIAYGLTFRQLAILGVAGVIGWLVWQALHTIVPVPVLIAAAIPAAGATVAIAMGRRDGLSLDRWLFAAIRGVRAPRRLAPPGSAPGPLPGWAPATTAAHPAPALLRLPAAGIGADGIVATGDGGHAALVAASTLNASLRTDDEQLALVGAFGRWLNSLSEPTQIVLSARPVDLHDRARALAQRAGQLPDPALEATARDHAAWLAELAETRHPLRRTSVIVCRTPGPARDAQRAATRTTRALSGLGLAAKPLNADTVGAVLAAAVDPFNPPADDHRAPAHTPVRYRSADTTPARAGDTPPPRSADRDPGANQRRGDGTDRGGSQ